MGEGEGGLFCVSPTTGKSLKNALVVICLRSQKQTEMLQVVYRRVSGRINNMDKVRVKQVTTEFLKEDTDAESVNKLEDLLSESLFSNPFVKYFEKKLKGIKECVQID